MLQRQIEPKSTGFPGRLLFAHQNTSKRYPREAAELPVPVPTSGPGCAMGSSVVLPSAVQDGSAAPRAAGSAPGHAPAFLLHNLLFQQVQMCFCLNLLQGISPSRKFKRTLTCALSPKGHKYLLPDQTPLQGREETTEASYKHPLFFKDDELILFCTDPGTIFCSSLPKHLIQAVSWSCCIPLRRLLTFIDSPSSYRRKFSLWAKRRARTFILRVKLIVLPKRPAARRAVTDPRRTRRQRSG